MKFSANCIGEESGTGFFTVVSVTAAKSYASRRLESGVSPGKVIKLIEFNSNAFGERLSPTGRVWVKPFGGKWSEME